MEVLKGKKLLVLGGSALMVDSVLTAKSMGIYTIVTDWHELAKSPAKRVADEYWNISLMDYEQLTKKIKDEKIDGIFTGFTDAFLLAYQHLCELTGLPCYATKEQFEISIDKSSFKKLCKQFGVGVVPEYLQDSFSPDIISKDNKVILKPVDNSGSNGIFICDNPKDYEKLIAKSLSFSKKGEILIERYMESDDVSFEYKIQNGEITLSSICDRFIHQEEGIGSVTSGLIYPSKYLDRYLQKEDAKVKRMFSSIGLRNGVLFMQAFVDEKQFYFYEMGYRLSGGRHYIFTENQNGDSSLKQLIHFALTGLMDTRRIADISKPDFKNVCCQLSILCRSSRINQIIGKDVVNAIPEVIDALYSYSEGDTVGKAGTSSQIFAKLHIVAHTIDELKEILSRIKNSIKVLDDEGNDLVVDFFELPNHRR